MANVRETENLLLLEVTRIQKSLKRRELIPYAFYAAAVLCFFFTWSYDGIAALFFLFGMLFQNQLWKQKGKFRQIQNGANGDLESESLLHDLPDDCFLVNDAEVRLKNGQKAKIDHIILTRGGVFVIESINASGRILGNCESVTQKWQQIIQTSSGKQVKREFYNPVSQVTTKASKLYEYLAQQGIKNVPSIHGMVLFTNKDVKLALSKRGSVPVALREEIKFHIQKMPAIYTDEQLNKVLPLLWELPQPKGVKFNEYVPLVTPKAIFWAYAYAIFLYVAISIQSSLGYGKLAYSMDAGSIFTQTSTSFLFTANIAALCYAVKMVMTYKQELR